MHGIKFYFAFKMLQSSHIDVRIIHKMLGKDERLNKIMK